MTRKEAEKRNKERNKEAEESAKRKKNMIKKLPKMQNIKKHDNIIYSFIQEAEVEVLLGIIDEFDIDSIYC